MAVEHKGFMELYNLTNKTVVSRLPLSHLNFLPRVGERVLISPRGPGNRESYKVVDIEYFLNYDPTEDGKRYSSFRNSSSLAAVISASGNQKIRGPRCSHPDRHRD